MQLPASHRRGPTSQLDLLLLRDHHSLVRKPLIGIGADVITEEGTTERAAGFLTYVDALRRAGAIPVIIPPDAHTAIDLIDVLDGVVLAGGSDCDPSVYGQECHSTVVPMDERRQSNDLELARLARAHSVPALGICLGMQMMNIAAGGTLIQDIPSQLQSDVRHAAEGETRTRHDVKVVEGTRLAWILAQRELNVNSSHHQAVGEIGAGLRVGAHALDGVVEAIEDPHHPFYLGLQWHPEDMKSEPSADAVFAAFVAAAREHVARKSGKL